MWLKPTDKRMWYKQPHNNFSILCLPYLLFGKMYVKWGTWYCICCNHPNRILTAMFQVKPKVSPYYGSFNICLLRFCFTVVDSCMCFLSVLHDSELEWAQQALFWRSCTYLCGTKSVCKWWSIFDYQKQGTHFCRKESYSDWNSKINCYKFTAYYLNDL